MNQPEAGIATATPTRALGNRVLLLLLLAYVFNFIDRQIIGILAVPIKAELALSDRQLGLMGGVAFALFYSTLALPIAWLADRKSRIAIISASVAVWSLFTALCGLAQNFWQLFLARMGVGIGEAGGVAPSYSLIADYFPSRSRARAMAFFSLGIPLGSALGIFFGGWIASSVDWRAAFVIVGLAGLPIALLLRLFVPEPVRGARDLAPTPAAPPFLEVLATLARNPSFWLLSFGAASGSILGYGLIFWLPALFTRSFGLSLGEIGWFYGSLILVGGMLGTWLGGVIGDQLGPRRPGAYAAIPALCFLLAAPAYAAALFAPSLPAAWLLFLIPQILGLAWLGPVITAVQQLVPPNMRATASASFLLVNNFIGIGFGVYIFGELSTRMNARYGDESLRYSILYGLVFYLLAATFYALASRRLKRDMIDPAAT
jgi:predicted MFS family arabinose efflux permease